MQDTYIDQIQQYLVKNGEEEKFGQHYQFINKLFFSYPSLKVDIEILNEINQKISDEFQVPFRDIRLIGSTHLGFSLVKWDVEKKESKFHDDKSDIDIAIINQDLFIQMLLKTYTSTNGYTDNTQFKEPSFPKQFKSNIASGYIRPDMLGDSSFRSHWLRFFKELSLEYNLKISAAIYLNEVFFVKKLERALDLYKKKLISEVEIDGTK